MKIILEILFITFHNLKFHFLEWKLSWQICIFIKFILIINKVKFIRKKQLIFAILDLKKKKLL